MAKQINFGSISEALNDKADRDLRNVDHGVTLSGRSGRGLISDSTNYWGNCGESSKDTCKQIFTIITSNNKKYLKSKTSFSDKFIPLYDFSVYKISDINYANLTCSAVLITKGAISKVLDLETFRNRMNCNNYNFYLKDIYTSEVTDDLINSGKDYAVYKDITIRIDKAQFTKTSIPQFLINRNYNLHNIAISHSSDSTGIEYAPIKGIMSNGLKIGEIGKDKSFEVTLDIDTSTTCGLFNSSNGNCDFNLWIKDGRIVGELVPHVCDDLNRYDTIKFNKNVLDWGTSITLEGDLNGLRIYSYTTTSINESHKIDKWQVKRISDNKLFWTEKAKSESAENNYLSSGSLVYTELVNSQAYSLSGDKEFEYVDPIVQGEVFYTQQHNFICMNGETEVFNVTFKTHKQIEADINCMFSAYTSDDKSFCVMINAKSNSVPMPEFWSQHDIPNQSHLIDDGTYLIVTDSLGEERIYEAINKRNCRRDEDGVWMNGMLQDKYIVGSFTVLCNAIIDAYYLPQV